MSQNIEAVNIDIFSVGGSGLSAERLAQYLNQLAQQKKIKTWCLAYSGGIDSQVLLHLLSRSKLKINAVYIDHGLQLQSAQWARHCEQQCLQLNIPFRVIKVKADPQKGESPEAAARNARYGALKQMVGADACLLTAQHQQDQAETVLLQLLRGGGAAGLAAMAQLAPFAQGWHSRPLLHITQQAIIDYAQKNQLNWVEDPSNQQQCYDRNYLRHSVIPGIQQRWPALNKTLQTFSQQQAENTELLATLAEIDLQTAQQDKNRLDINALKKLSDARLRNALRYWFKAQQTPLPSRSVLQQIVKQMLNASAQANMRVSWANNEIRCFRESLYSLSQCTHSAGQVHEWNTDKPLIIESLNIKLQIKKGRSENTFYLNNTLLKHPLNVRFRQGGERIKPAGRKGHHDLKSLFQEAAVPPWQRDKIPLLYAGENLLVVVGYWLADEFSIKGEGWLPEVQQL